MKKLNVIIGQRHDFVLKKIQTMIDQEKFNNLAIYYCYNEISNIKEKIRDLRPDIIIIITGQIYNDSLVNGEYGSDLRLYCTVLDQDRDPEIYLFSTEIVENCKSFTDIIEGYEKLIELLQQRNQQFNC
jgi:hypothetical protein